MSETDENTAPPEATTADKRRAALEKARKTAKDNRERRAEERKAHLRNASDVRPMHPTESERAQPAREGTVIGVRGDDLPPRRRRDERTQALEIPKHLKKSGWDYQFITITVLNQPVDRSNIRDYTDNGQWRPVSDPALCRHFDAPDGGPIELMGQRLYERPMSYTQQARTEDFNAAENQRRDKVMAAASGASTGRGDPGMPHDRAVHRVPLDIVVEEAQGRLGGVR